MNKALSARFLIMGMLVTGASVGRLAADIAQWSRLYYHNLSNAERAQLQTRSKNVFIKEFRFPVTQMLLSWNALRPHHGYLSFSIQVRDQATGRWSDWMHAAEWGAGVQRSFHTEPLFGPTFNNVRLDMPSHHLADACRVAVQAHGGASLALLYRISVAAADFYRFTSEVNRHINAPSIDIKGIPLISQMRLDHADRHRICSPTSLCMVVSYLNDHQENPEQFADGVYDYGLAQYGSWPFNVAHAFSRVAGRAYFSVVRLNSFEQLYAYLRKGLPVVVSVRLRGRQRLPGMPQGHTYHDGHLMVVVGWDNVHKCVRCLDPAQPQNNRVPTCYPLKNFLAAWENPASPRLAYVADWREE